MEALWQLAVAVWSLTRAMAPYLLLGFLVAGMVEVLMPPGFITRHLGGEGPWAVVKASLLGIPLPLCSCGVLPLAVQLRNSGSGKAPTLSFMITTPVTGVDSLLATYSLLGGFLTLARLLASILVGMISGMTMALLQVLRPESSATPESERHKSLADTVCAEKNCSDCIEKTRRAGVVSRILKYAFHDLPIAVAGPVLAGFLLGGLLTVLLPEGFVQHNLGGRLAGIALATIIGLPFYVCSSGAIPIAAAMVLKGFTPGAALAFLIASPASNTVAVATVNRVLGGRALLVYMTTILGGAFLAGVVFDQLAPALPDWEKAVLSREDGGSSVFDLQLLSALTLSLMLLFHFIRNTIQVLSKR